MAGFGGAVKLTGEAEYKRQLSEITQKLKMVGAEMKAVNGMYDRNDHSVDALKAKLEVLNKKFSEQTEKVKVLTSRYKAMKEQYGANSEAQEKLNKKIEKERAELDKLGNEYGKTSEAYQKQAKVVEKLENKQISYNKAVDEANRKMVEAQADVNRTSREIGNLKSELDKSKRAVEESGKAYGKLKNTISEQEEKLKSLKIEYANVIMEQGKNSNASKDLAKQIGILSGSLQDNKSKMSEAEKEADKLDKSLTGTGDDAKKASDGFTVLKGVLSNLASTAIQELKSSLQGLSREIVNIGIDFESAMSKVAAVSGADGEDLIKLTEKAKKMGESTKFTATESAEAFNYMAMAGWKTGDMLDGIEGIMNLAAAAGSDLALTSDIVTDALTAMGYSAKDAGTLADVMAAASSNANTNVELMGKTFQYAAPIVGALGYNMQDTAVAIGLMANAGIKGEKAGTALRSILTRLSAPPKDCADAMQKLGISITDANGQMKPLDQVLQDLRTSFSKLGQAEQAEMADSLAGKEAMSGLLAIVNAAPEDYNKLTKAVKNADGTAKKMADTMNDNLGGQMTLFKSKLEGIALTIFEKLSPSLREGLKGVEKIVDGVDWKAFGKTISDVFNQALQGFKWIINNKNTVVNALKLIMAGFAVKNMNKWTQGLNDGLKSLVDITKNTKDFIKVTYAQKEAENTVTAATKLGTIAQVAHNTASTAGAVATKGLAAAQNALNAAWKANPIGLIISGVTLATTVFSIFADQTDKLDESEKQLNEEFEAQKAKLEDNKKSWEDLEETRKKAIDTGMAEVANYQALYQELETLVDENGKVKEGYEERVSFIVSELSDALGVEIKMVGNVVEGYKDLKNSIDEVIEKKKAQIILDAQEGRYREAVEKQVETSRELEKTLDDLNQKKKESAELDKQITEIEKALAQSQADTEEELFWEELQRLKDKRTEKDKEVTETRNHYRDLKKLCQDYNDAITEYDLNLALFHDKQYHLITNTTWGAQKQFSDAMDAWGASLEQAVSNAENELKKARELYAAHGDEVHKRLLENAEKRLSAAKKSLEDYNAETRTKLENNKGIWNSQLGNILTLIAGHKLNFKKAGDGNVQMYIDGIKSGEPQAVNSMKSLVTSAVNEINKQKHSAKIAGENLIEGVDIGITNPIKQNSVIKNIVKFGKSLLGNLQNSLKEASPSKATEKMGEFLIQGLSLGIKNKEKPLFNQLNLFGKNVLGTLTDKLSDNVDLSAFNGIKSANLNRIKSVDNLKNPMVTRYNYFYLVEAFKSALSQMTVEMDDETMGKFVERTVAGAIYT